MCKKRDTKNGGFDTMHVDYAQVYDLEIILLYGYSVQGYAASQ